MTLEEQIAQAALENEGGVTQNTLIPVDLGNGQILQFNNPEELSANLRQALAQVNQEVVGMKQQLAQYQSQAATTQQGQYATQDEPTYNQGPKFDFNEFVDKMKKNPLEGLDYADQFRAKPYEKDLEELKALKQEAEVNKFLKAHPEFPGGQFAHVLNSTREELGLPMTQIGLEAALVHAAQTNRMPDFKLQYALQNQANQIAQYLQANGIQLPQQNQQPQNNYVAQQPVVQQYQQQPQYNQFQGNQFQGNRPGIPSVPRNQPQQYTATEQALENMSYEQLESFVMKNGLKT